MKRISVFIACSLLVIGAPILVFAKDKSLEKSQSQQNVITEVRVVVNRYSDGQMYRPDYPRFQNEINQLLHQGWIMSGPMLSQDGWLTQMMVHYKGDKR
jgi:hypothetical protein